MPGGTTQAEEICDSANSMSEVTRHLCAAAHLHHSVIYTPLQDRFNDLRADTPEYFVDMESLKREAEIAHKREILRLWIVGGTAAAAGLATMIKGDEALLVPALCVLGLIEVIFEYLRQEYVRSRFLRERFSIDKSESVEPSSEQNVVIAEGFSPFVGSGNNVFSWSFVVDLTKPSGEGPPQPLAPADVYKEVTDSLRELNIPRIVVSDKLFVHGEKLRGSKAILSSCGITPQTHVSEEVVESEIGKIRDHLRHYRVLQVSTWGGQLVLSLFLRFTAIGQALFVEVKLFTLPPLLSKFRAVDNLTKSITGRQLRNILLMSAIKGLFTWIEAGLSSLGAASRFFSPKINDQRESANDNERFNYGWNKSLREEWSGDSYEDYFQMLDKDMYSKILQSRIIDAIVNTLEAKGISTEAIKEQRTTILNQGIIGNVQTEAISVGTKSAATIVKQVLAKGGKGNPPAGSGQKL